MPDGNSRPLDYSTLPVGSRPPVAKRELVILIGTWLLCSHALLFSIIGIVINISNIFSPCARYRWGDSVMTPISDGIAVDLIRLIACLGLAILMIAILVKTQRRF